MTQDLRSRSILIETSELCIFYAGFLFMVIVVIGMLAHTG